MDVYVITNTEDHLLIDDAGAVIYSNDEESMVSLAQRYCDQFGVTQYVYPIDYDRLVSEHQVTCIDLKN